MRCVRLITLVSYVRYWCNHTPSALGKVWDTRAAECDPLLVTAQKRGHAWTVQDCMITNTPLKELGRSWRKRNPQG
jgi:hypothetical protein